MNYRHSYHAGNFADVFKHLILIALTQSFLRKDSAFCYLDTHGGAGRYDLFSDTAQINKEFENGVTKILSADSRPPLINTYLECIKQLNIESELRFYPGSPYFVKAFLRANDQMILSELHPEEYHLLKKILGHHKQIAIHCQDAYQSLKAFLPPKERRGFVLIDPPYEKADELERLTKTLPDILKRWETGTYAIWYPIKNRSVVDRFIHTLKSKINHPILISELIIYPEHLQFQLNGCGIAIINPPWQLDKTLEEIVPWLWRVLSVNKQGRYVINAPCI